MLEYISSHGELIRLWHVGFVADMIKICMYCINELWLLLIWLKYWTFTCLNDFTKHKNMYLHFLSFLVTEVTEMPQVVQIIPPVCLWLGSSEISLLSTRRFYKFWNIWIVSHIVLHVIILCIWQTFFSLHLCIKFETMEAQLPTHCK